MMAVSYTTDLTHFLDERGAIPADLPKQAQQLAANLGEIVASVTVYTRENPKTNVSCWINKSKKPCAGKIEAGFNLDSFDILWHCPKCDTHGSITNWENTFWDCGSDDFLDAILEQPFLEL